MFEYSKVISKKIAGEWAKDKLDKRWSKLVEKAMLWEKGEHLKYSTESTYLFQL